MEHITTKMLEAIDFFVYVFTELAILFILISFLVGLIQQFITPERIKHWLDARNGRGYAIGAALGALSPFCSCSTIPIMTGLLKARAGFGPTMSFLFSSPLISPVIVTLFASLIGIKLTVIYVLMSLGLAVIAGYLLQKAGFERHVRREVVEGSETQAACCDGGSPASATAVPSQAAPQPIMMGGLQPAPAGPGGVCCSPAGSIELPLAAPPQPSALPWPQRLKMLFWDALKLFRSFIPYVALGVAVGALVKGFVPTDFIASLAGPDNPLAIPAAALIGVPLYIRASAIMPIALGFMAKGMSLGAVLALVIGSAGASLPEVVLLKRVFRWPLLAAFLAVVFFMAVSIGIVGQLLG